MGARSTPRIGLLAGLVLGLWANPAWAGEPLPPRYDEAPPPAIPEFDVDAGAGEDEPVPLREVPFDGRGRMATGGLAGGLGLGLLISGIVLATRADARPEVFGPPLGMGAAGLVAGALLLPWGILQHKEYRRWEAAQTEDVPRQGYGLVAPGAVLMVGGVVCAGVAAIQWVEAETDYAAIFQPPPPRGAQVAVGLGATAFVAGVTVFALGVPRTRRFTEWRRRPSVAEPIVWMPVLAPSREGLQLGVVGRF